MVTSSTPPSGRLTHCTFAAELAIALPEVSVNVGERKDSMMDILFYGLAKTDTFCTGHNHIGVRGTNTVVNKYTGITETCLELIA